MTQTADHRPLGDYTDGERAEWQFHYGRLSDLQAQYQEAKESIAGWMLYRHSHPEAADFALEQADHDAVKAAELWERRGEASRAADATPYGAALKADLAASIARRRATRA